MIFITHRKLGILWFLGMFVGGLGLPGEFHNPHHRIVASVASVPSFVSDSRVDVPTISACARHAWSNTLNSAETAPCQAPPLRTVFATHAWQAWRYIGTAHAAGKAAGAGSKRSPSIMRCDVRPAARYASTLVSETLFIAEHNPSDFR